MSDGIKTKRTLMFVLNIASLILLGVILQIGGAYIVNAAVEILGGGAASGGVATEAAMDYKDFMDKIRSIEPRQFVHVIFVAPLVEEIVFRLIFLRASKMIMPFWAANLVQSTLFAIYHTVSIQRVYAFAMGLIVGCVFYYCPIIYRNTYSAPAEETSGRAVLQSGKNKTAGLLDLPNCLIGAALTFILHVVINSAGLFVAPLLPADIPYSYQFAIGFAFMLIASLAVFSLFRRSK